MSEDNENVAIDYENLSMVYRERGEIKQAIKCIKEALRINKLCLGDCHAEVAGNLSSLSNLLAKQVIFFSSATFVTEKMYFGFVLE